MEHLKTFLCQRFNSFFPLLIGTGISLFLLMVRLKLTHSFFLLFLVWNLFLAAIPYFITTWLSAKNTHPRWLLGLSFLVWLVFLPNAPYILTDFIHLTHRQSNKLLFDFLLIGSFAICGMLFYLNTFKEMKGLLARHFSERFIRFIFWLIPFLCGFGIFLGRFLRWNSWDIVQHPGTLMNEILTIVTNPLQHKVAWATTLLFGVFLILMSAVYRYFLQIQGSKPINSV